MNTYFKISGIITIGLMIFSCNNNHNYSANDSTTPVWLEDVKYRSIEEYITTTGTAKAAKTIEIKSEISGLYNIQKNPKTGRPYQLGDVVQAGAVIVRLGNKEHENNTQLESKKLQILITEKEWEGQKMLLEKGGATEKDVNSAKNAFINAKLALENAHINLEKLSITAPFKGVIVDLPYLTPGVEAPSGSEIVDIMDYSKMYIETEFPENTLTKLTVGQNVHITNYNIKQEVLKGVLTQISPALNEDTRTFSGYIEIDNPKLKLRPGMFAKADIVTIRKDSILTIPKKLLKDYHGNKVVYTIDRNSAIEKTLKTGISDENYIEIVSGLKADDQIVRKGHEWLRNKSKVKIMK